MVVPTPLIASLTALEQTPCSKVRSTSSRCSLQALLSLLNVQTTHVHQQTGTIQTANSCSLLPPSNLVCVPQSSSKIITGASKESSVHGTEIRIHWEIRVPQLSALGRSLVVSTLWHSALVVRHVVSDPFSCPDPFPYSFYYFS
jgi:hypothetical protein